MRAMRLKNQELSEKTSIEVLKRGTSGVLAVLGEEEYPYAVPLSYVFSDGKIYFHGAKTGHKLDAIEKHDKVSFCVVDQDEVIPEEYTTYYRSVIAFGRACVIEAEEEKRKALELLGEKYMPQCREGYLQEIDNKIDKLSIIELRIERLTGKEAIELVEKGNRQA